MSTPADTGPPPEQLAGDRSRGELISEVTGDLSTLMRQELELAKAEVQQSASRAGAPGCPDDPEPKTCRPARSICARRTAFAGR